MSSVSIRQIECRLEKPSGNAAEVKALIKMQLHLHGRLTSANKRRPDNLHLGPVRFADSGPVRHAEACLQEGSGLIIIRKIFRHADEKNAHTKKMLRKL